MYYSLIFLFNKCVCVCVYFLVFHLLLLSCLHIVGHIRSDITGMENTYVKLHKILYVSINNENFIKPCFKMCVLYCKDLFFGGGVLHVRCPRFFGSKRD